MTNPDAGRPTPPAAGAADRMDEHDASAPVSPDAVDRMFDRLDAGGGAAVTELMPLVYDELRRVARRYVRRERAPSLQATDLVHEAYLRLARDRPRRWENRTHFIAVAAIGMRRVLVERARARGAAKRGRDPVRVSLCDALAAEPDAGVDLLALDDALTALAALDARQARIVELRFFGGLTVEETAEAAGVSPATVKRDWTLARAWLQRELGGAPGEAGRHGGS